MNLSQLLTASLAGAVVCFISGAEASPRFQAPMFSPLPLQAGFKCGLVNGQLVCGDKKKSSSKHNDDDDQGNNNDDDDDNQKPQAKKAKDCKKARCEPGMFVLEKPNIYGACCQAGAEPLKHNTKPDEPKTCQFPGEVGTPPNCTCPDGTEFMGYRGCLPKKADPVGPSPKKVEQKVCCKGKFPNGDFAGGACGAPEAAVREIVGSARKLNDPTTAPSSITCAPE